MPYKSWRERDSRSVIAKFKVLNSLFDIGLLINPQEAAYPVVVDFDP